MCQCFFIGISPFLSEDEELRLRRMDVEGKVSRTYNSAQGGMSDVLMPQKYSKVEKKLSKYFWIPRGNCETIIKNFEILFAKMENINIDNWPLNTFIP